MRLTDLHIGVSPLTDTIYLGTLSKREPGMWNSKVDCTNLFIRALMEWVPPGTIRTITDNHKNTFEIEIRKVTPMEAL